MLGYTMEQMSIGQSASFSKTVSESDVYAFAGISGDFNPAHIDQVYSSKTRFKQRIVHGILSAGFISALIGTKLPGPGSIYLGQELKFTMPVYIGDTVTAYVTILELKPEKNIVRLETVCKNQNDEVVIKGIATILAPQKP